MRPELGRRVDVTVVERRVLHQLAVVVPVAARDRDQAGRLEDEMPLRPFRHEAVRRPAGDHDVVARTVGHVAEHRLEGPLPLVHEHDLVPLAVPEEGLHALRRAAERDLHVVVPHQQAPAADLVARGLRLPGGEVAVRVRLRHPLVPLDRLELADLLDPAR